MIIFSPLKGTMEYTLPAPLTMQVLDSFKLIFQAKIGVEAVALPRILSLPQPEQLRPSAKLSLSSTVNLLVSIWILIYRKTLKINYLEWDIVNIYRLFFLRSIAHFFTQICMNCFSQFII